MEKRFSQICSWFRKKTAKKDVYLGNKAAPGFAHLEHVLHFDDAALQDGGTHRWDLDGTTVPRLSAPGTHDISTQGAHHRALLLHGATSDEGLCLNDIGFGHH